MQMVFYLVGFFCLVAIFIALVLRYVAGNDGHDDYEGDMQMAEGAAMTADWTSMKICYWPNGTWCYRWELEQMTHMSDDYAVTEMLPGKSPIEIDDAVQELVKRGYK